MMAIKCATRHEQQGGREELPITQHHMHEAYQNTCIDAVERAIGLNIEFKSGFYI